MRYFQFFIHVHVHECVLSWSMCDSTCTLILLCSVTVNNNVIALHLLAKYHVTSVQYKTNLLFFCFCFIFIIGHQTSTYTRERLCKYWRSKWNSAENELSCMLFCFLFLLSPGQCQLSLRLSRIRETNKLDFEIKLSITLNSNHFKLKFNLPTRFSLFFPFTRSVWKWEQQLTFSAQVFELRPFYHSWNCSG